METKTAPELDFRQAELILATTESAIPALRIRLAETVNRLAVLLGEHPAELHALLAKPAAIPSPPASVVVGLPSEVIRQRPDVRRSERLLAAQNARIGVATADLYPRFSLFGFLDLQSVETQDFLDAGNLAGAIAPSFRWNIFNGGRVRSAIEGEDARTEQALARYENTVLHAIEEVESAFVAYVEEFTRRDALRRSVAAAERSVELVEVLYRSDIVDFQNVLDLQRALTNQQDLLAQSEGVVALNLIRIYKALGGGWTAGAAESEE